MTEDVDSRLNDLESRLNSLNRARSYLLDEVEDLREENEQLRERVTELESIVEPNPGSTEYEQLTRSQKVHRIRRSLVEKASATNGKFALKYDEVQWLFDGHPSPSHCYDLMELAGDLDGFVYDQAGPNGEGQKRIRVKLDSVNDESLIYAAKNAPSSEVA